jgi:hypothetical protein
MLVRFCKMLLQDAFAKCMMVMLTVSDGTSVQFNTQQRTDTMQVRYAGSMQRIAALQNVE